MNRPHNPLLCRLFVVALVLSLGGLANGGQPVVLEPAWHWRSDDQIEWAQPVRSHESVGVLVATGSGQLHLIDLKTGRERLAQPIQARPGIRPANSDWRNVDLLTTQPGTHANNPQLDLIYCYDRYTVYAIDATSSAGLRWRVGTWRTGLHERAARGSTADDVFQGDPEELRRIVAAHATREGVLVARDDGQVALLAKNDGHVVWEMRLPRFSMLRMHVSGHTAALIWKSGPRVSATLVNVQSGHRRNLALPPTASWPIWSELSSKGFITVYVDRLVIWKTDGSLLSHDIVAPNRIHASAVGLHVCRPMANKPPRELLLFGTCDGKLYACDLGLGTILWSVADQSSDMGTWARIEARGEVLVAAANRGTSLRRIQNGEFRSHYTAGADERLCDLGWSAEAVWLLHGENDSGKTNLSLTPLRIPADTDQSMQAVTRRYQAGSASVFLRAIWGEDKVVVATRNELRAYDLP